LILTKPLGTGIVGTAIKFGRAPADLIDRAVEQMRTLNKAAAEAIAATCITEQCVHACTDITGFGLAGHGSEMAAGSNVTIEIDSAAVPIIPGVREIASENLSGGLKTNKEHFGPGVEFAASVDATLRDLMFDPQTSGGLLISVAPEAAGRLAENIEKAGIQATFVGTVTERQKSLIIIG
jgi:selenide,water dikinase